MVGHREVREGFLEAAAAEMSLAGRSAGAVAPGAACWLQAGHVGSKSHEATPPPYSFLWKKWKNLYVGDVVRLRKDSIVPVSPLSTVEHPRGGSLSNPDSSLLHPRPTCFCWPAQSPVVCATWRPQTLMGKKPWLPWALRQQNPASPVAKKRARQASLQSNSVSVPRPKGLDPALTL